jgi:hypothetical protein
MIAQIQVRRGTTAEWAAAAPVVLAAGEPGYDSSLKRFKVGDGATAWVGLPWADYGTNPNILHNWDFRNPVNQRGVSGSISATGYFYDRWLLNSGTVTVASAYLTLANAAVIEQRIEGLNLAGTVVCVSVNLEGTIISGSGAFPSSAGTASVTLTGFGTATLGYNAGYMYVLLTADAARNVTAVKVEMGTTSTLHLDPPVDRGVELMKCYRYYIRLKSTISYGSYGIFMAESNNLLRVTIVLPTQMRILPTYSTYGLNNKPYGSVYGHNTPLILLYLEANSGTPYTVGQIYTVSNDNNTNGYIDFSADL